jgi:hypothetical protein
MDQDTFPSLGAAVNSEESPEEPSESDGTFPTDSVNEIQSEQSYEEPSLPQPPPQPAPQPNYNQQADQADDPLAWIYDTTDINKYTENLLREIGGNYARTVAEKEIDDLTRATAWAAKRVHSGKDGLPSYDSVVGNEVAAFVRQRPEVVTWLQAQPNPAEAAFFFGCLLRYPHLLNVLRSQGVDAFYQHVRGHVRGNVARPSARPRSGGRSGGHSAPRKLTAVQIQSMDSAEFERELDRFKQRGF